MKLEEKLVYLRKEQGLSQLKLAEKMNVSRQAISRWETGVAFPSADNLKYLSNLYDVSLDYLLNDSADVPEGTKKITNKPADEIFSETESVDADRISKKNILKWVAIVLILLVLIVVAYKFVFDDNEDDFVIINDVQRKVVETESGLGFDFEW